MTASRAGAAPWRRMGSGICRLRSIGEAARPTAGPSHKHSTAAVSFRTAAPFENCCVLRIGNPWMLRSVIRDLNGVGRRPQAVITLMDVFARNFLECLGHGLGLDLVGRNL